MAESTGHIPSLGEAVTLYLGKLSAKEQDARQPVIYKFARWYGLDNSFEKLAGPAIGTYAERLDISDLDYQKKFEILRTFFAYAKKAGWSTTNLATHLKAKKSKTAAPSTSTMNNKKQKNQPDVISLTQVRYDEMQEELAVLKKRSQELVKEVQRAAADKDFRENAPLHAAREERGHVEGRIKELEQTLKNSSIIVENKNPTRKSSIGDKVVVCEEGSTEEICYMIVDTREVNVAKGKISFSSPLGKALLGHADGEMVEIVAPAGRIKYEIRRIER
jgi:transcription elongation factor GreA